MKNSISLSDFRFMVVSYGRYEVTYTSPVTGKEYTAQTTHMPLIDATKNSDNPTKRDLICLKAVCRKRF